MRKVGKSPYVDMWPYAIELLEYLAEHPNVPLSVLYNTARLLELRKRTGAEEFWQQLAQPATDLPRPIRRIVCEKPVCPSPLKQSPKARWDLPVKLGVHVKRDKAALKTLSQWYNIPSQVYEIREKIDRHPDGSAEVLAFKRVEMVVFKKLEPLTRDDLSAYCGQPLRQRGVVNGTIWTCHHWAALVVDEKVEEVWGVKLSTTQ